jgi:hypothetical protein
VFWQHYKSLVDLENEGGMEDNANYWVQPEKKMMRMTMMTTMTTTMMMTA